MIQTLWLPIKFPGLNDYVDANRRNKFVGHNMKEEYTNAVTLLAKKNGITVKYPVIINFVWQEENSKRDPDNIIFAKKFILDGLVNAGVLPNDTQKWILGFSDSWVAQPPKNSKTKGQPNIQVGVLLTIKEII